MNSHNKKQSEEKRRETKDHLDNIIENSLDAIMLSDSIGYITRVNRYFLEMLNYKEEEVIGKHTMELTPMNESGIYECTTGEVVQIDKEYTDDASTMIYRLFVEGKVVNWESYYTRKDKKLVPVEQNIVCLYNEKGERTEAVAIIRDITERRKAEKKIKETRDFLENIFRTSADGIIIADPKGCITMANEAVEKMLGYSQDELIGKHTKVLIPKGKKHQERRKELLTKLMEDGTLSAVERTWLKKDGSSFDIEENVALLKDKEGTIAGSIASIRDITERKRAQDNLRATKDQLDNIIASSLDSIIVSDKKGTITRVNKALLKLLNREEEEVIGKGIHELSITEQGTYESTSDELVHINEEFFSDAKAMTERLFEEGKVSNWKSYYLRKDKKVVPVEMSIVLLYNKKGDITGAVGINRDITERKKIETKLKESEERYQNLIEFANAGIIVAENNKITQVNSKAEEIYGYPKDELIGQSPRILTPEKYRKKHKGLLQETAKSREAKKTIFEEEGIRKGGSLFPIEISFTLTLKDEQMVIAVVRDITERKKAEKEIKEAREFLENIIGNITDGVVTCDLNGVIINTNRALERMTGIRKDELIGKHLSILIKKDKEIRKRFIKRAEQLFNTGHTSYETVIDNRDGKHVEVDCNCSLLRDEKGEYIAGVSVLRDITKRKEMEDKLLQSKKLKSLGELAGGVAHDFNNMLAAILGRVQLARKILTDPQGRRGRRKSLSELEKSMQVIEKAALDGAETVRRIQEFSRKRDDGRYLTKVDLNSVIDDALEFTRVRWKNEAEAKGIKIQINKALSPHPPITGSISDLREVVTNLINNAIEAIPQGGTITIQTLQEDDHITTHVKDTGTGIPKAIRDMIFDPFFTTKGIQSTGLGLSISYGIITRHGGTITVDSVKDQGTTFSIQLPLSENTSKEKNPQPPLITQSKSSILVIEDEQDVRELLSDILTNGGHKVTTAPDGLKGIELFKEKEYDLVFTDLGMPGMSGMQVANTIKTTQSTTPVALITGWAVQLENSELKKSGVDLILNKPFKVEQVLQLVQDCMELKEKVIKNAVTAPQTSEKKKPSARRVRNKGRAR